MSTKKRKRADSLSSFIVEDDDYLIPKDYSYFPPSSDKASELDAIDAIEFDLDLDLDRDDDLQSILRVEDGEIDITNLIRGEFDAVAIVVQDYCLPCRTLLNDNMLLSKGSLEKFLKLNTKSTSPIYDKVLACRDYYDKCKTREVINYIAASEKLPVPMRKRRKRIVSKEEKNAKQRMWYARRMAEAKK
jgi:hypothetical protein